MSQPALFDQAVSFEDSAELSVPDEVIESPKGYVISIYRPQEQLFKEWLRDVDETIMDMTGYSVHDFAVVPTFGIWNEWPVDPYDAVIAILSQDLWGQAYLGDLDLA